METSETWCTLLLFSSRPAEGAWPRGFQADSSLLQITRSKTQKERGKQAHSCGLQTGGSAELPPDWHENSHLSITTARLVVSTQMSKLLSVLLLVKSRVPARSAVCVNPKDQNWLQLQHWRCCSWAPGVSVCMFAGCWAKESFALPEESSFPGFC